MDFPTFVQIVRSFADGEFDVDAENGRVLAQIRDEFLDLRVTDDLGVLYCEEAGQKPEVAGKWIVRRLGRLDLLAQRILEHIRPDERVIPVEGKVVDVLEADPNGEPKQTPDVVAALAEVLGSSLAGLTKVVYLTSDAGEGKTTVIEHLAREQAERYLAGDSRWILLPVQLGGRQFTRLDDVVVGTLSNRLRFLYYYYGSVVELVKLGAIVLALDGFEEMFVETKTGEATTSLSNLITQLDSRGRLLVAARSTFYQYRDVEAHVKLSQALRNVNVAFADVSLLRWNVAQFIAYADRLGLTETEAMQLHRGIAERIGQEGAEHPLLTRAVLASKLLEEFADSDDPEQLVQRLASATGEQYFEEFVTRLVTREVREKWVDLSASGHAPAQPILSVEEHHVLLAAIAEEMWRAGVEALDAESIEGIAEVITEVVLERPAATVRQARQRITQHALLQKVGDTRLLQFDHEDFRNFYLGRRAADFLLMGSQAELRLMLEERRLPDISIRVGVSRSVQGFGGDEVMMAGAVSTLCGLAAAGRRTSYLRENASRIALELVHSASLSEVTLKDLYIRSGGMRGIRLEGMLFQSCSFERFDFDPQAQRRLRFESCEITHLTLPKGSHDVEAALDDASVPAELSLTDGEADHRHFYDPAQILVALYQAGFRVEGHLVQEATVEAEIEPDDHLRVVDKVVLCFQRATALSESAIQGRLWRGGRGLFDGMLPDLVSRGLLEEVRFEGSGVQRRFKLGYPVDVIAQAREESRGDFNRFMAALPAEG